MCPSGKNNKQTMEMGDRDKPTAIVAPSFYMAAAQHHRPSRSSSSASASISASISSISSTKPGRAEEEEEECCRHCGSRSLRVDWSQGDKVCTECGIVAEERLRDETPEWRDYNEPDDIAKGAPSGARSGMVAVDESRYIGGLQPTSLSSTPFGATATSSQNAAQLSLMRKRLLSTNRKLDHMMGQHHARALNSARISRMVRKRQLQDGSITGMETDQSDLDESVAGDDHHHDVRPELEQVLIREEEDANRMHDALNADKWSLRRAILLHGNHESVVDNDIAAISERADLQSRLDSKLRKASADLYLAYQMLTSASRRLEVPDRVTQEATAMLCRYAARRDGFQVKGVSSRLALKKSNMSAVQKKEAADCLREHNKWKQMGSLSAALLLLTARKLGWPRPLAEVCGCVQAPKSNNNRSANNSTDSSFIKPKHCARAIDEIKASFPDYARSMSAITPDGQLSTATSSQSTVATTPRDPASIINFVDHAVRKLQLPPVAEASIRALVWHCCHEQHTTGHQSGTKLSTICASVAYFVSCSGNIMQQLASQAQMKEKQSNQQHIRNSKSNNNGTRFRLLATKKKKKRSSSAMAMPPPPNKKPKAMNMPPPPSKKPKVVGAMPPPPSKKPKVEVAMPPPLPKKPTRIVSEVSLEDKEEEGAINEISIDDIFGDDQAFDAEKNGDQFDVFSHAVGSELLAQKREYEMRRVWDAWVSQEKWLRSVSEVEQSSGVASKTILAHYKTYIYPRRQALLEWLRDAVVVGDSKATSSAAGESSVGTEILTETPMATVLLSHVAAAAPLLNPSGRTDFR